jgi:hypothetical protein
MPTPTYDLIATTTLAAASSEVVFGSIPQGYRDLILIDNAIANGGATLGMLLRYNGDVASNYSTVFMFGDVSNSVTSGTTTVTGAIASRIPNVNRSAGVTTIMDYSATDKHKTSLSRGNALGQSNVSVIAYASRWNNTAAITSLTVLIEDAASFQSGSTLSLYGVIA